MRWLQLHLRSRRVPLALTTATALIALSWALSLAYTDATTISARTASLAIMLAVVAGGTTLSGADDALDHTMAVNWPVRRAGHLLLAAAAITALLSLRGCPVRTVSKPPPTGDGHSGSPGSRSTGNRSRRRPATAAP